MKIIHLMAWRDRMLALTAEGEVFDLRLIDDTGNHALHPTMTLLWPASPYGRVVYHPICPRCGAGADDRHR